MVGFLEAPLIPPETPDRKPDESTAKARPALPSQRHGGSLGPSLEEVRRGTEGLTPEQRAAAMKGFIDALRGNRDTLKEGLTPGTGRAQDERVKRIKLRIEGRAFWPKGKP
jgi:hypothetical protein